MHKNNPLAVNQIRAAGTPMPGKRQSPQPTKAQIEKRSKNDDILSRLIKLETTVSKIIEGIKRIEENYAISALERHVALELIGQQVGMEAVQSLMMQRAKNFGLHLEYKTEKVNEDGQDNSNEPNKGNSPISSPEGYEGSENYS